MGKGRAALFRGAGFAGHEVVRDREDGEGALFRPGGVHVERRSLHLDGEDAHRRPFFVLGVDRVEGVGREDVADLEAVAEGLAGLDGLAQQPEVRDRGERPRQPELGAVVGVGAGALGEDQVADAEVGVVGAGGADADNGVDVVEIEKLVGIDADRGDSHPVAHHADFLSLIGSREAEHPADPVHDDRVFEVVVRHILGAERVAGHDDGPGDFVVVGPDVGRGGLVR